MRENSKFWYDSDNLQEDYTIAKDDPPKYLCMDCFTILGNVLTETLPAELDCSVCKSNKLAPINFDDFTIHYRNLIETISNYANPLMKALLRSLHHSQNFVHFSTYGISREFVGVLKVISQRVAVRGIVSNIDKDYAEELRNYTSENPQLRLVFFEKRDGWGDSDVSPHQKLLIIDGLIAFKGAANLTLSGWRNAQEGLDVAEVVTNVRRVREFHNRYFQPLWDSEQSQATGTEDIITEILSEDELPF